MNIVLYRIISYYIVLYCVRVYVQLLAIGPTTAAELARRLGRVDGIAAKPDADHLCQVLTQLRASQSMSCPT